MMPSLEFPKYLWFPESLLLPCLDEHRHSMNTTNAFEFFLLTSLFQYRQQLPRWEEKGRVVFWGGFFF